jgi:hypothetical protein
MKPTYIWQVSYEAALLETDLYNLNNRIAAAKTAIRDRQEDSLHGRDCIDGAERQAIEQALSYLRLLQRECAA